MTKQERAELAQAFRLVWYGGEDGQWEAGMRILARMAGLRVPALEITGTPVTIWELNAKLEREKPAPGLAIPMLPLEDGDGEAV